MRQDTAFFARDKRVQGRSLIDGVLKGALVSAIASALLMTAPAFAQVVPGGVTREEIQRGADTLSRQAEGQPISIDSEFERAPCPLAAPEFASTRFTLAKVQFNGAETIDRGLLADSFAPYIGTEQSVAVICDIRDRAATALRSQGFLAAVQVPPQSISEGVVTLDLLVAKMTRVEIRGDAGASEKLLTRYIAKLSDQPVFNIIDAERYLLLMRDIPGLDVRLALRPANAAPGEVIGEFSVIHTPVFADVAVQNLGSREVGRFGGLARLRLNGITGLGDQTTISAFSTLDFDEQQVIQLAHRMTLGGEGFTIGGDFTYSWSEPSVGANGLLDSETLVANIDIRYPFIRSQASNLSGTFGFEYIDQNVDFGVGPLTRDTLSVLYGRLNYSAISAESVTGRDGYSAIEPRLGLQAGVEVRQGLDIFGASEGCGPNQLGCILGGVIPPSRIEADGTNFVFRADARFDYRPTPQLLLSLAPRAQYAPDPLLAYEEFSGGNFTVGRGFDPGAIIGDSGVGVRSEVAYGSLLPNGPQASAFQPYAFFDAAWVWNEDNSFPLADPQDLYSIGAGLRANIRNTATLDALIAVPLNAAGFQTSTGDVRFLLTLSVQLAPWNWR